jgi:hypothetical protein
VEAGEEAGLHDQTSFPRLRQRVIWGDQRRTALPGGGGTVRHRPVHGGKVAPASGGRRAPSRHGRRRRRERADVASARAAWFEAQPELDRERLILIDETCFS